ncbi:MAG TPA: aldehyde dehydrogenase (NADP(+)), partial [Candidatus Synoicihabitans sp.]|nr:aldehyde dehydrogenase (NADP(+)) [Candidatus Synoicihabitans sp.]
MTLHGQSYIAGRPLASTGATFRAINPATNAELAPDFRQATLAEAGAALEAAASAFKVFRQRSSAERAQLLETIATNVEAIGDAVITRAQEETALPVARLQGERARTCNQLRQFARLVHEGSWVDARIDRADRQRQPLPKPDVRRMLIPLGPVVVFGSSNFPFAFSVAGGDTASALAAGCPVVVKAHRAHPGTSELVAEAITRAVRSAGLPGGLFSLVHGGGESVGIAMVKHPATAAVGFTGSYTAGRALFDAAAARPRPIPVFAEMSSLNPTFLLPEALRERGAAIAQGLFTSFTLGAGQFCTKPGLVFALRSSETDAFLAALTTTVTQAGTATMLTPSIHHTFLEHRKTITTTRGVTVLATGAGEAPNACAPQIAVTSASNFLQQRELAMEAFGPFALLILAESPAELEGCAQSLDGQLTATLHGTATDFARASGLLSVLQQRAGRLVFNGFPTGVEVCAAMHHGGPFPATTDARFTSVGTAAILRFARPVCYQDCPEPLLPPELRDANPRSL